MKKLAPILAIVLATSACMSHKINYRNPSVPPAGPKISQDQTFFLWGLIGGREVDLQMCSAGVASIESKFSIVDGIAHWLTGGLYSPMTVEVQCGGSYAARAER